MKYVFLIALFFVSSCARNPATDNYDFVIMDQDDEYELGRALRKNISNSKIYKDRELQDYLSSLAINVYNEGERIGQDFNFYFLNSDIPNAFATPGYMFLNRGVMPFLHDEASLMGVMAHEAAHINARHIVQSHSDNFLVRWLLNSVQAGGFAINNKSANTLHGLSMYAHSRDHEYEADYLALRYLNGLSVPAENSMLAYKSFAKLRQLNSDLINLNSYNATKEKPYFYRTHPEGEARAKKIADLTSVSLSDIEYYNQSKYYNMIDGLEYGYYGSQSKSSLISSESNIIKSSKSGVYGFKNTAYFKNYGLKMLMPSSYQARIMGSDPIGYDYKKGINVSVLQISDDKTIDGLDVFADLIKLTPSEKKRLSSDVSIQNSSLNKNLQKITQNLKLKEQLFSYADYDNMFKRLFNIDSMYYYIYIKQLNKLDENAEHKDLFNNFRVIVLSSNSKKSFDESMLNDILFIKDNLVELSAEQKAKIKPLVIKTIQADNAAFIRDIAENNTPYIHFNQEWFKLINGIYNEYDTQIKSNQWLKLIPNSNKDI